MKDGVLKMEKAIKLEGNPEEISVRSAGGLDGSGGKTAIIRRFLRKKRSAAGLLILFLLTVLAVFAPAIAPQNPYTMTDQFGAEPSFAHWLGTDQLGRDLLSRLIYASRVSLIVGIATTLLCAAIGTVLGLISGYFGGLADAIIMRTADIVMTFPPMILLLVIVGLIGSGLEKIILVLSLLSWPGIARLVRGSVLAVKEMNFIKAAAMMGLSKGRILFAHLLPNIMAPILVNSTFKVAGFIVTEASLSFLGLGIQPPLASWGNMLTDAKSLTVLTSMPWLWLPPCLLILITVLAFNFMGDGLSEALNPETDSD